MTSQDRSGPPSDTAIVADARNLGLPISITLLETARDIQERSPSAYGIFGVLLDGELLSYLCLLEKDLAELITPRR